MITTMAKKSNLLNNLYQNLGIGVDIEDISRFRKFSFRKKPCFYKKIFTEEEIRYCLSKPDPAPHFAARFCAKEAFIKAQGANISGKMTSSKNDAKRYSQIDYKHIEVIVKNKRPFIKWNKQFYLLSLSHDKDKAIAFVIVLRMF